MNESDIKFSWLVPVGPKSQPDQLEQCLASIIPQMTSADELVLVRDAAEQQWRCDYHWAEYHGRAFGPLIKGDPQGMAWPCRANQLTNVVTVDAGDPRDCGKALNCGLIKVKNPYVIRQDADDWDVEFKGQTRRAKHVEQIMAHPECDAWGLGMRTCQWIGNETPWQAKNPCIPPMLDQEGDLRERVHEALRLGFCPVYHPATCFKTTSILKVGAWCEGFHGFEDWGLYLRMHLAGMTFWADQEPYIMHRRRHQDNPRQRAEIDDCNVKKAAAFELMEQGLEPDPSGWRMKPYSFNGIKDPFVKDPFVKEHVPFDPSTPVKYEEGYDPTKPQMISEMDAMVDQIEGIKTEPVKKSPRKRRPSSSPPSGDGSPGKTPCEPGSSPVTPSGDVQSPQVDPASF